MFLPLTFLCAALAALLPGPAFSGKIVNLNVNQLTINDNAKLGKELSQALNLYHQKDFARALPIFRRIAGHASQVQNVDLMFWIGTSAARAGECEAAVEQLKKVLAEKPGLVRARLELGAAHFRCRQYDKAQAVFEALLDGGPPPDIVSVARKYLKNIEIQKRKFKWRFRAAVGVQHDGNVGARPEDVDDLAGIAPALPDGAESGWNWIGNVNAGFRYDAGRLGGLLWEGKARFLTTNSFEASQYNYLAASAEAGPVWQWSRDVFRLPASAAYRQYGNDSLSVQAAIGPEVEHYFMDELSLVAGYSGTVENYMNKAYEDAGFDNVDHRIMAGPNYYMLGNRMVISGRYTRQEHDAEADDQSYHADHGSVSFAASLPTSTEIFLQYVRTRRRYHGASALYGVRREDDRNTVVGVIAQHFFDHFFGAIEGVYVHNDGNRDLFDFEKVAVAFTLGVTY